MFDQIQIEPTIEEPLPSRLALERSGPPRRAINDHDAREAHADFAGGGDPERDSPILAGSLCPRLAPPMPLWKRGMDAVGSLVGLLLLSPLLLIVAVVIKLTSRGPVIFLQRRIGFLERPFMIWKFRTMTEHADTAVHEQYVGRLMKSDHKLEKLSRDAQLTPPGKWLRKSCIDELPQLINVLVGNMSLVGPRPDVVPLEQYADWHRQRFDVLPGMTGLWQVSGKNKTTVTQMIRLDISYIRRRSFALDVAILLKTVPAILSQLWEPHSS